nr:MAG TPA: hypothetical protein [Caudoviricetes sp.]
MAGRIGDFQNLKKKTGDGALVEQYTDLPTSKLSKASPAVVYTTLIILSKMQCHCKI